MSHDKQRDIDAEGQRAAIFHAQKDNLPQERGRDRILGINSQGVRVNNVTERNRRDVDKSKPWLQIHLMNESLSHIMKSVFIPNTRERPDVVLYNGKPYEVHDTTLPVPQYRECLYATAVASIPQEGTDETR